MCGICGEIRFDDGYASLEAVNQMMGKMNSRGPDTVGTKRQGRVCFGHNRLKIIDLSELSQQPLITAVSITTKNSEMSCEQKATIFSPKVIPK